MELYDGEYVYVAGEWIERILSGLDRRYLEAREVRAWLENLLGRGIGSKEAKVVWCELRSCKGGSRWIAFPIEAIELLVLYKASNVKLRIALLGAKTHRGNLFNYKFKVLVKQLKGSKPFTILSLKCLRELGILSPLVTPKNEKKFFGTRYVFTRALKGKGKKLIRGQRVSFFGFAGKAGKSIVDVHYPYWYHKPMNYYDKLVDLISIQGRFSFIGGDGQAPKFDSEEFNSDSGLGSHLYEILEDAMKQAYKLGHAQGALVTLNSLPEDVQNLYDFNKELDNSLSERSWDKVKGQLQE